MKTVEKNILPTHHKPQLKIKLCDAILQLLLYSHLDDYLEIGRGEGVKNMSEVGGLSYIQAQANIICTSHLKVR